MRNGTKIYQITIDNQDYQGTMEELANKLYMSKSCFSDYKCNKDMWYKPTYLGQVENQYTLYKFGETLCTGNAYEIANVVNRSPKWVFWAVRKEKEDNRGYQVVHKGYKLV